MALLSVSQRPKMATARKKQEDAENLKTLRELVSLPHNKHCFDCNQRGPTYVNVTIGSFVCTKCSGMLRGLTPPHRVKSISMATFTAEEIALLQNRGNDYCRRTWLGLYEGSPLAEGRDEQQIHDLMIDKYERRRYYLEAPVTRTNGALPQTKPLNHLVPEPKALRLNGVNNDSKNDTARNLLSNSKTTSVGGGGKTSSATTTTTTNFVANFDIFNTVNNNNNNNTTTTQPSFANFDNNPVFNNTKDRFSIFDLQFSPCGPMLNQVPLFPKCGGASRWSKSDPFLLANGLEEDLTNDWVNFDSGGSFLDYSNTSMPTSNNMSNLNQQKNNANMPPAPPEDRYAALKDLDNALKSQSALDWNSGGSSSGSLYSSSTPAGSMYSSPSPQSMYGSPSQGHFGGSVFTSSQDATNSTSNPFNNSSGSSSMWGGNAVVSNGSSSSSNQNQNPFRASDSFKTNGFSHHDFFPAAQVNGVAWTPNPFKIGSSNGHSSNPFL